MAVPHVDRVLSGCAQTEGAVSSGDSNVEIDRNAVVRYAQATPPTQFDPIEIKSEIAAMSYVGALYDGLTGLTTDGLVRVAPRAIPLRKMDSSGRTPYVATRFSMTPRP